MRALLGSVVLLAMIGACSKETPLAEDSGSAPVPRDAPAAAPPLPTATVAEAPPVETAGAETPVAAVVENDCAVLGALAREHYGASRDDPPTRVTLDGAEPGARWMADCDWNGLGVNYVLDEGPTPPPDLMSMAHVSFREPTYDETGASVKTSITPPDGSSPAVHICKVLSGVAGWTVGACTPG